MEQKLQLKLPNRIEISEIGHEFLQRLPAELDKLGAPDPLERQYSTTHSFSLPRKGNSLDFYAYANQTQHLLHRQTQTLKRLHQLDTGSSESKRKVKLHHDHWLSEQKLISHKVADTQARILQTKYSDYDWRGVGIYLKKSADSILSEWHENS